MMSTALYGKAVSKLRRPFLFDRYFFITVRLPPACQRRDADRKGGGPRYLPLSLIASAVKVCLAAFVNHLGQTGKFRRQENPVPG